MSKAIEKAIKLLEEGRLQLPDCKCPVGWLKEHNNIHHSYCPLWHWDNALCLIDQALAALKPAPCEPSSPAGELHIEDADIIADLSGGRLTIQQFRKRVAEQQAHIDRLEGENERLKEGLVDYIKSHIGGYLRKKGKPIQKYNSTEAVLLDFVGYIENKGKEQ